MTNEMKNNFDANTLQDDVALVTGGGSGLGFEIAKALISVGAKVCITGRRNDVIESAVDALGDGATYCQGDVTNAEDRRHMIEHTCTHFDADISILINNAGQNVKCAALEVSDEDFDALLNTHVKAAFSLARQVGSKMIEAKRGNIIFMASMASFMGVPNIIGYTTAKTAVLGLTRGLAAEWSSSGIRVNAIAPGWIRTPMTDKAFGGDSARKQKVLDRTPMQNMGEPGDIAQMAVFLCSSSAQFVTGQCFRVDGGASIGF